MNEPKLPGYYWMMGHMLEPSLVWFQDGMLYFGGEMLRNGEISEHGKPFFLAKDMQNVSYEGPIPPEVVALATIHTVAALKKSLTKLRVYEVLG